ncbi:preprotein translocase subunit SecG [Brumimicrobium salinarum]|uniref:Protein-export membrane protein SecG n=1 Tax=Brumimicrobium salinarum TaxID=2058658 RepID=A0A2I0R1V1_9FLAO|nr:preprotein translocase subunit SecG [Brumimicrobium salinarum]PKR80547.1 preprotein translocase subunit SecG [Brumimicrobium salinarum]
MGTLLTVLIIIASVLLVLVVLMQNPKGGGLSTDFGSAHQMGGVKQTNDFIEKTTWSLAGVIAVLSIVMTLMYHEPVIVPQQDDAATEQQAPADNSGEGAVQE